MSDEGASTRRGLTRGSRGASPTDPSVAVALQALAAAVQVGAGVAAGQVCLEGREHA